MMDLSFRFAPFTKIVMMSSLVVLTACQTSRIKLFDDVKPGQSKTTVLESLGGPDREIREEGLDRWIYVIYDKDLDHPYWKELQFVHNNVTYIGDRVKAPQTADQVDAANEASNRAEEARLNKIEEANDKQLGRIKKSAPSKLNNDDVDEDAERSKKAPTFVPVQ